MTANYSGMIFVNITLNLNEKYSNTKGTKIVVGGGNFGHNDIFVE